MPIKESLCPDHGAPGQNLANRPTQKRIFERELTHERVSAGLTLALLPPHFPHLFTPIWSPISIVIKSSPISKGPE